MTTGVGGRTAVEDENGAERSRSSRLEEENSPAAGGHGRERDLGSMESLDLGPLTAASSGILRLITRRWFGG